MDLLASLHKYFELQKEIHDYFGYQEDWRVIPLSNDTECYWFISNDILVYSKDPFTPETFDGGEFYSAEIFKQRFLPKYVYRTDDFTMVSVDTRTDMNVFLMVLSNDRECKDQSLIEHYLSGEYAGFC